MAGRRLSIKTKLNYRRGGERNHCGGCDHYVPNYVVMGIGGKALKTDSRCRVIGLENSHSYRVDYHAVCDRYDNTLKLRRLGR